jgi:hypothetical protein
MADKKPGLRVCFKGLSVCRLPAGSALPMRCLEGEFFVLSKTPDELSIVCEEKLAPEGAQRENGFLAIKVDAVLDFSLVGIIADISSALATAGVSIFVVSTYDTDYIMIREINVKKAADALARAGYDVKGG